jgi:hypothetical protein
VEEKKESNQKPALIRVHVVDWKNTNSTCTEIAPMHFPHMRLNAILLPDWAVLVSGGEKKIEDKTSAALYAESMIHPAIHGQ